MLTLLLACATPSTPSDVQDDDFNPVRDTAFFDSDSCDTPMSANAKPRWAGMGVPTGGHGGGLRRGWQNMT